MENDRQGRGREGEAASIQGWSWGVQEQRPGCLFGSGSEGGYLERIILIHAGPVFLCALQMHSHPSPILPVPREAGLSGPPGGRQVSPEASPCLPCSGSETCLLPGPFRPRSTGAPLLPALPTAPVLLVFSPQRIFLSTFLYQTLHKMPNLSVTPLFPARTCFALLLSLGLLAAAALRGEEDRGVSSFDTQLAKGKIHPVEWEEAAPSHPRMGTLTFWPVIMRGHSSVKV